MKNLVKNLPLALTFSVFLLGMLAFTVNGDWDVPAEYVKMVNPTDADNSSLSNGKQLYTLHCKSCHGKYGEGDGPKAANLKTDCGDFTSEDFQEQSDGSLFYKTKFGRDEMPTFEKKITDDEDLWDLVNYLRELGE